MSNRSFQNRAGKYWTHCVAVVALLGFGLAAMAQTEPTLNQVYEAANSGKLVDAQGMMKQVLTAHPGSAKAHFVQAELYAKQGQMGSAKEALATAEKLAPGLPFAKADAVQHLRTQLAALPAVKNNPPATSNGFNRPERAAAASPPPESSFPTGLALALGGGALGLGIYLTRKKAVPAAANSTAYSSAPHPGSAYGTAGSVNSGSGIGSQVAAPAAAMQGSLGGPQSFGAGAPAPAYGQQPGYGQPGNGLGGKVMGGLATGLAVGAGVMAAQAIGRSLSGNNEHPQNHAGNLANDVTMPSASNAGYSGNDDLGGQNFGVNDTSSWDDNTSVADNGGGGDWDT